MKNWLSAHRKSCRQYFTVPHHMGFRTWSALPVGQTRFSVSTSYGLVLLRDDRRRHHFTLCPICALLFPVLLSSHALPHYLTNPTIICTTPCSSTPNTATMVNYNVLYAA